MVLVLLCSMLGLSACAIVRVEGDDGSVRVERGLGLLTVQLSPESRSVYAQMTALGVARTWEGLTVGYYAGSVLALSQNDCRLVVWAEDPAQVEHIRRLLDGRGDVCVFAEGGESRASNAEW